MEKITQKRKTGRAIWLSKEAINRIYDYVNRKYNKSMANKMSFNTAQLEILDDLDKKTRYSVV